MSNYTITEVEDLRALFPAPSERAVRKQLDKLDRHCRRFIQLSPFVVIASGNSSAFDASPRGGPPGFVRVPDKETLQIPDSPGNNRLDSLANIVETGRVGLLFLIPGVDETLRVNGDARIDVNPELLAGFDDGKRSPRVVIEVTVREVYLHCAKALMRSRLWSEDARQDRAVLPTLGEILADQLCSGASPETQEQMLERYRKEL